VIGIAWAALFLWPVVSFVFYRKLPLPMALSLTLLGGYLFLPAKVGLDFPMLPAVNKESIPTFSALVLTAVAVRQNWQLSPIATGWIPRSPVVLILFLMLVCGVFGTAFTNQDAMIVGPRVFSGSSLYDAFSTLLRLVGVLGAFFLGRMVLSSYEAQRIFLKTLVILAIGYSFLALWEVRMSPQLHIQIYGYFPSQFAQVMRGSGFRPAVFLGHGLPVAAFFASSVIAAAALFRDSKEKERVLWMLAMVWLFAVLVLCKSLGALLITLVLVPITLFLTTRLQLLAALCIVGIILIFPVLRSADLVPVDRIMDLAAEIDPARAASFKVRVVNEERLLEKAMERPVFGWGGWGRQRVYNENGVDITTTDGGWVIILGNGGWVRYIATFGLLCWPIVGLFFQRGSKVDPVCIGLMFILCAKLIDLIPNSGILPIFWLVAGALSGRLEVGSGLQQPLLDNLKNSTRRFYHAREVAQDKRYAREFPKIDGKVARQTQVDPKEKPRRAVTYKRSNTAGGYSR
jgi:hypothetical protein